ncbi:hypothetical protein [Mucilaginibacter rubeus]|uniref:Uncharacterized protein n=1 Tax=Mucilaginibacter rubeus TaxID=2027860 RepID=A0A5C1HVN7_9SPHI|nr:hypothetical protein [Mucilaginibacter rubeus]QEM09131.1 hypothetical protein DEO27_003565 [Mucilaginibacter rubeus]
MIKTRLPGIFLLRLLNQNSNDLLRKPNMISEIDRVTMLLKRPLYTGFAKNNVGFRCAVTL